jgi:hypothetical protein
MTNSVKPMIAKEGPVVSVPTANKVGDVWLERSA